VILSFSTQKGGVGKTTSAVNVSVALARQGRGPVLLVDTDPAANATLGLGYDKASVEYGRSSAAMLIDAVPAEQVAIATDIDGLSLIPAHEDLQDLELNSADDTAMGRATRLKRALASATSQYKIIVLDTPAGFGVTGLNALVAADYVIVPFRPAFYDVDGVEQYLRYVERTRTAYGVAAQVLGVFATQADFRAKAAQQAIDYVREQVGSAQVMRTTIRQNTRLSEAPGHGLDIFAYDPSSHGARAYLALTQEILERLKPRKATAAKKTKRGGKR
jgi:chromosome partitioning protein